MMLPSTYRAFSGRSMRSEAFTTFGCVTSVSQTGRQKRRSRVGITRVPANLRSNASGHEVNDVESLGVHGPAPSEPEDRIGCPQFVECIEHDGSDFATVCLIA